MVHRGVRNSKCCAWWALIWREFVICAIDSRAGGLEMHDDERLKLEITSSGADLGTLQGIGNAGYGEGWFMGHIRRPCARDSVGREGFFMDIRKWETSSWENMMHLVAKAESSRQLMLRSVSFPTDVFSVLS